MPWIIATAASGTILLTWSGRIVRDIETSTVRAIVDVGLMALRLRPGIHVEGLIVQTVFCCIIRIFVSASALSLPGHEAPIDFLFPLAWPLGLEIVSSLKDVEC